MAVDARFSAFIHDCRQILAEPAVQATQLAHLKARLVPLLGEPGWLPGSHAVPREDRYAQYLLYAAPDDSFSVVSFVWRPGQWTPVHDHTVWGVIGVHQGVERTEIWQHDASGTIACTRRFDAGVGEVGSVSPETGDIHRVGNVSNDTAISIHLYGGNIGAIRRHTYDEAGVAHAFVSGYEAPAALMTD